MSCVTYYTSTCGEEESTPQSNQPGTEEDSISEVHNINDQSTSQQEEVEANGDNLPRANAL